MIEVVEIDKKRDKCYIKSSCKDLLMLSEIFESLSNADDHESRVFQMLTRIELKEAIERMKA